MRRWSAQRSPFLAVTWAKGRAERTGHAVRSDPATEQALVHRMAPSWRSGVLVSVPGPAGHLTKRVKFLVGVGVGVLARHVRAELHVLANCLTKRFIGGHANGVQ